jgi:uroporphyrinogen-III synthase
MPLIEVTGPVDSGPLHRAAREGSHYDSWIFTSAPAVEAFFARQPSPPGASALLFAVGEATADALARHGHVATTPDRHAAEGLLDSIAARLAPRARLLVAQAADARSTLVDGLSSRGFEVDCVATHDKILPPTATMDFADLFETEAYGWVTFTSSRIVEHFVALAGPSWPDRRRELLAASIGPMTSQSLRAQGVEPRVEAESPSDDHLVNAIARAAQA